MIVLENVKKGFGGRTVVADVCVAVKAGEAYGLLGPNGAGKTTILRMILGTERPDAGAVRVLGETPKRSGWLLKRRIGVVSEHQHLYERMTTREYLGFFARLYAVDRPIASVADVIERLGISPYADRMISTLSHGMRQKVNLARALVHDPDLLILDEPISGLDPRNVRDIRDVLLGLRKAGKTLLICSHVLSEVERTSDRVGILHQGRLLAEGRVEELAARLGEEQELHVELREEVQGGWLAALGAVEGVHRVEARGCELVCRIAGDRDVRPAVSQTLTRMGATLVGMGLRRMTLEEAYLTITDQAVEALAGGVRRQ